MVTTRSSSSKKRYSIEFLPDELMFQIFALLPVISLLRCKSVCKSWLSIILNPKFIETHLIESQKRHPLSLLKRGCESFYVDTDLETSSLFQLPKSIFIDNDACYFESCCNGLVCLADNFDDVLYLWNPMTRQCKKLPTPLNKAAYCGWFVIGFGYDKFCNDYKILRIVFKEVTTMKDLMVVEMYSANEDSWKAIEVPKTLQFFEFFLSQDLGVFLPQTPWVLYFQGSYELLSFDLRAEVFRVYPYHVPLNRGMSNLLNFEGSLAMIYDKCGESFYSLWTLDIGDCGHASWTERFNLENSLKNDFIVLYMGDGQFVVAENYDSFPVYCYYNMKLAKKFHQGPLKRMHRPFKYNESLASVKGFEKVE